MFTFVQRASAITVACKNIFFVPMKNNARLKLTELRNRSGKPSATFKAATCSTVPKARLVVRG